MNRANWARVLCGVLFAVFSVLLMAFVSPLSAEESPSPEPEKYSLWIGEAPIGDGKTEQVQVFLHVYRPVPEKASGAAVVICPGGGYTRLDIQPEGHDIARWLVKHGIAGMVLEYRLPHGRALVPLLDAQRAIRTVRSKAKEWKIDPKHIGVMGFSAGGHLAASAGTHFDSGNPQAADPIDQLSCRPNFMILVYPMITHGGSSLLGTNPKPELLELFANEKQVTQETPPTFLTHAKDDRVVPAEESRIFLKALQAHKVPAEYLELPWGDHEINHFQGPTWDAWQKRALEWLAEQKMLSPAVENKSASAIKDNSKEKTPNESAKVITDLEEIATQLAHIRDVAAQHEKWFENLWVKGRFEPKEEAFSLVLKDRKCRYDLEVAFSDGRRSTSYWLDDGRAFLSWGGDLLVLDPTLGSRRKQIDTIASPFWLYLMPPVRFGAEDLGLHKYHVSEYCEHLVRMINHGAIPQLSMTLQLKARAHQIAIEVETTRADGIPVMQSSLSLDADKNYVMTRYWERSSANDGPDVRLSEQEIRSQYREISPGVFFITHGKWWQKTSGTRPKKAGMESENTTSIEIDSAEYGDFPVAETHFNIHSWPPIKLGIKVHDARVKPPLQYIYDREPFDQNVLEQALGKERLELARQERITAAVTKAFAKSGGLAERLDRAMREAKLKSQWVLLILADPTSDVCRQLYGSYLENEEVQKAFLNYQLLPIDVREGDDALPTLKERLKAEIGQRPPLLWVINDNGELCALADLQKIAKETKVNPKRIVDFLRAHAPKMPDAEALLTDALVRAEQEGKCILLEETGVYCGWCAVLARFLESHWDILGQDYILVKIDSDRFTHGEEVMLRIRRQTGGIPWMAILNAKGKVLITSDGPKGNIGFPNDPEGIEHFLAMITATAQRLTPKQRAKLREALASEKASKQ